MDARANRVTVVETIASTLNQRVFAASLLLKIVHASNFQQRAFGKPRKPPQTLKPRQKFKNPWKSDKLAEKRPCGNNKCLGINVLAVAA